MPELKFTSIEYYSQGDERAFFEWLDRIASVEKVGGVGTDLLLRISSTSVPDEDLRELIALVTRYLTDASQLRQFLNASNKRWFHDNKEAFWHNSVFGR